jgi:hypothetical protein
MKIKKLAPSIATESATALGYLGDFWYRNYLGGCPTTLISSVTIVNSVRGYATDRDAATAVGRE